MKTRDLLVIFDHQLSYRSYKETNILDDLEKNFTTTILIIGSKPENITSKFDSRNKLIRLKTFESFFLAFYANTYWYKVARNSLSIQNRTWYGTNKISNFFSAKNLGRVYYKCFHRTPLLLSRIFLYRVLKLIELNINVLRKTKVLYVTAGGTNSISDLLVSFLSEKDIEFSVIVENWDNMSSKAVFDYPPLRIGVWGDQSIKFGKEIHKIDLDRMIPLGNPRVEWLINNFKSDKPRKHIFFGGGSVNLNVEILFLNVAVKKAKSTNAKVYYLPHPKFYNQINSTFIGTESENLIIVGEVEGRQRDYKSLPKLTEYLPLFQEAMVFVSSLSTLNLEASLLGIPSIAIDLETSIPLLKNLISERHDHIKDIRDADLFYFVKDLNTFEVLLSDLFESIDSKSITFKKSRTLNYLINNTGNYTDKLVKFLQ